MTVKNLNAFTSAEKTKLANIEEGAEVNVQSDWNQTDDTQDDFIKNKPEAVNGGGYFIAQEETTCTNDLQYYKVDATFTPWAVENLFEWDGINKRFKFTGTETRTFNFTIDITAESSVNNSRITYTMYHNGAMMTGVEAVKDFLNQNKEHRMGLNAQITMSTNDYLELWVKSDTAGAVARTSNAQLSAR